MLFPSVEFAVFFSLVFAGSWLLRPFPRRWRWFVLAASYVFYGWWDPRFTLLLLTSTVVNAGAARLISASPGEGRRRGLLVAAVAANVGVLGVFKYYGFLVQSVIEGFGRLGLGVTPPLLEVVLPVGVSFYTFQAISYVVDVYRRDVEPSPLLDVAVYLAFFPGLVAGPIVRVHELVPQLDRRPDPRHLEAARALRLIVRGLFKKVVIASFLGAAIVDPVFAVPGAHSSLEVLFATYGYAVQIYADFSGYTDIAIGSALLLGIRLPRNFDAPYTARSLREFWRRWHLTLSRWLRDYVYVPLGGNRGPVRRVQRNLMLTMILGGLWHGASWTFVVWGAVHGVALGVERWWVARPARHPGGEAADAVPRPAHPFLRWLVTFHVVCLAWIFFRAESFSVAGELLVRLLVGWGPAPLVTPLVVAVVAGSVAAQFVPAGVGQRVQVGLSRLRPVPQGVALGVTLFVIDALGPPGVPPFIYFQF